MARTKKVVARKPVVKNQSEVTLAEHIKENTTFVGFFGADFCDEGFQNLNSSQNGWGTDNGFNTIEEASAALADEDCSAIVKIEIVSVRPQVAGFIRLEDIPEKSSAKASAKAS